MTNVTESAQKFLKVLDNYGSSIHELFGDDEDFTAAKAALEKAVATPPNPKIASWWRHKETKKEFKVVPWWMIPDPVVELSAEETKTSGLSEDKRMAQFGALVQVGWLIENEHNVFIGIGLKAEEHFEDITNEKTKS